MCGRSKVVATVTRGLRTPGASFSRLWSVLRSFRPVLCSVLYAMLLQSRQLAAVFFAQCLARSCFRPPFHAVLHILTDSHLIYLPNRAIIPWGSAFANTCMHLTMRHVQPPCDAIGHDGFPSVHLTIRSHLDTPTQPPRFARPV